MGSVLVWQLRMAAMFWLVVVLKAVLVYPHQVKLTFPRELRLLTPIDFNFVFQQPIRAGSPQITLLARPNGLNHPRLGLTIAKKYVKRAHDRNRLKRVIREYFRSRQHELPAMDFVLLVKKGVTELNNPTLTQMLEKLWRRQSLAFAAC